MQSLRARKCIAVCCSMFYLWVCCDLRVTATRNNTTRWNNFWLHYDGRVAGTQVYCSELQYVLLMSVLRPASSTHCHTLQHTATHCNTLQHTATQYSTLQNSATHCNTLRHTATHCNTLQHTATHCNTLQHTATHCNTLQHTTTHCKTLQHTQITAAHYNTSRWLRALDSRARVVRCSVLQCAVVQCRVLQCVL